MVNRRRILLAIKMSTVNTREVSYWREIPFRDARFPLFYNGLRHLGNVLNHTEKGGGDNIQFNGMYAHEEPKHWGT
jgi:hypothetical protein